MRLLTASLLAISAFATQLPPPPPPPRAPVQGQPPRDIVPRPQQPAGTGVIRGRVVAADSGNAIRRANVSLSPIMPAVSPAPLPPGATTTMTRTMIDGMPATVTTSTGMTVNISSRPRSATTDAQGMFEFTGLPAGAYRVFASSGQYSAAYLGAAFGATRPTSPGGMQDPGTPIQLAEGQRFDKATIALPRGAVITGRVSDENGEPMARVQVYTMFMPGATGRPMRTGGNASTDDLGQFRLFGLAPGDYVVVAEARGPQFVPPNAVVETEDDNIGFMTTYFPGTADEASAQRVRTKLGTETPGVEIRMVSGRLFRISGTITDSQGRSSSRTSGTLTRGTAGGAMTSMGFSTDEQGRFQMRNIAPGNYRLVVRGRAGMPPNGPAPGGDVGEMAIVPLAVSADLEGIVIVTGPGATVTGQITFEQGPPQAAPGQNAPTLRVTAQIADPQNAGPVPTPQPAAVGPDYTFALKGMMGEFLLRANAPGQTLKAVMLGGQDITDTPREFKNGERVTLVMTSAVSAIEGTVTDTKGAPVSEASLIIFSEDKASWRPNSLRTRRGGVDATGHFRITGLVPGRYHAIAAPRDVINVPTMMQDAAFFEALSKEATTFVVGEGEQRQVDLKLVTTIGG